jgi:hypothetical protein
LGKFADPLNASAMDRCVWLIRPALAKCKGIEKGQEKETSTRPVVAHQFHAPPHPLTPCPLICFKLRCVVFVNEK